MVKKYDHKKIEKKWQNVWEKHGIYKASDKSSKKKKFYSLIEFPYPSAAGLHVGHVRSYTALDIVSRKRRMQGRNVLYPIGWDAFGLPTENYAIKTGIAPALVTKKNTDIFRRQLKSLGLSFDWSREINTTDPAYYKWTQWIFQQFWKKGLAYKAKAEINWCPKDKIGLANEEVVEGRCERCGSPVEKREKEQWMLAITKYADRLDKDLELVDYPERVKLSQRNWIGKSEGSEIEFKLVTDRGKNFSEIAPSETKRQGTRAFLKNSSPDPRVKIFTTRADTLFGATYLVLAPEHELVKTLKPSIRNFDEVEKYIKSVKRKTELERTAEGKEKTGVELNGIKAVNPASGEKIPVWIADYVLPQYGTGAIMAVPAHDERDYAFAGKYGLPIRYVVAPYFLDKKNPPKEDQAFVPRKAVECYIVNPKNNHYLFLDWKVTDWKGPVSGGVEEGENLIDAALREIREETGYKNLKFIRHLGSPIRADFYHPHKKENRAAEFHGLYFELLNEERDPIEETEFAKHETKWVPFEKALDFLNEGITFFKRIENENLCYAEEGKLVNSGKFNDLYSQTAARKITKFVGGKMVTKFKLRDWVFSRQRYWGEPIPLVYCQKCGWQAVPEKDLPVLLPKVKSYQPTDTGESPLAAITSWVNTKCPKCKGLAKRETDTMPNWAGSSWYYLRYIDPKNKKTFADKAKMKYWIPVDWYNGGMEHTTLHLLYSRFWHKFLYDQKLVPTKEPYQKRTSHGMILGEGGVKMSKSLGNVINPDDIVRLYGADTLRIYEMFIGPFEEAAAWSAESIIGSRRFLEKVWRVSRKLALKTSRPLLQLLHKTVKKVGEDIEKMRFNTAISAMMVLVNEMDNPPEGGGISKDDFKKFLQILGPFAPHLTEELWLTLGEKKSIHLSAWPKWNPKLLKESQVKIAVSVNGKVRAEIMISTEESEESIREKALLEPAVRKYTEGKEPKKMIYVKDRLINIVP